MKLNDFATVVKSDWEANDNVEAKLGKEEEEGLNSWLEAIDASRLALIPWSESFTVGKKKQSEMKNTSEILLKMNEEK